MRIYIGLLLLLTFAATGAAAQSTAANPDSGTFDPDGNRSHHARSPHARNCELRSSEVAQRN